MFLLSRRRRGPDPLLGWKVRLFWGGAVLGVGGMFLNSAWWVVGGIVVLALGVTLALVSRRRWGRVDGEKRSQEEGEEP